MASRSGAGVEKKGGPRTATNLGRDLFSIQLEVTEKLMEAEEKKLRVLKAEIEASKHSDTAGDTEKAKELETQENNYLRIKMQHQRLAQEMQEIAVAGLIQRKPKMKASRSLPAIIMKQPPRARPSVFDHLVQKTEHASPAQSGSSSLLQGSMTSIAASSLLTPGQHSEELEYKDGILVAGSLEALIDLLIPTETHYPERAYIFAFILCSRLFLRPYELLSRVSRVFHMRQKHGTSAGNPVASSSTAQKMVQLMGEWTETFPYDFRDERMMRALKELTQTCASLSPDLRKLVGQLQSTLVMKLSILDKYEHILAQINAVSMERLIDPKTQVNLLRVCDDPAILAQQLTHIELERLINIGPEEFIQTFVKTPDETEPLYRDMKKTSNLEAYVEWFNRLSYLVATEICVADKKRNRAKLIEFFADTALECRKLNNYNSYMAISAGLFMSPVTRLKKTRAKVSTTKLQLIEGFVDPINNFAQYRQALEASISQADQAQKRGWVVPFFSLIVKDIYFMHEGMTNRLQNGYIRFDKCMSQARLVSQILAYKDTVLPFPRVRAALNYLMTIPVHTDDELQMASYEIEPPENSGEKKRYQELKENGSLVPRLQVLITCSMQKRRGKAQEILVTCNDVRLMLGSFGQRIRHPSGGSTTSATPTSPNFPPILEEY